MILTVWLVLVPSSPGLRPGLSDAETPSRPLQSILGDRVCVFFAKKPSFIGKMMDFGVRRLNLRVQMFNL